MKSKEAKTWQLVLFPMNDVATNIIMMLMVFVTYLYTGAIGSSVIFISSFLTGMRFFDAVTDPVIGFIIDHTKGRFGKFRPMILTGYCLMAVSLLIMYFAAPAAPSNMRVPLFIVMYLIYIVGYTFQAACTKAGQTCITTDQSQRPIITRSFAIGSIFVFTVMPMYASNYIAAKYQGFTTQGLQEFCITAVLVAGIFTAMSVAALWTRDIPENWGDNSNQAKLGWKDYLKIVKENHPLQLLIISEASDKLASMCSGNSSVTIMLFGIILGNYGLNGIMGFLVIIPNIIFVVIGTGLARKRGSKKTMQRYSVYSIILYGLLGVLIAIVKPGQIHFSGISLMTILFVVLYVAARGVQTVSTSMALPMVADCTDYETVRSGFYAPGMIGTIYSFIDKMISSLATTIVGFLMAAIGYTSSLPQPGDTVTQGIVVITIISFIIIPIIGWIINIIALHFYELDEVKMKEIQEKLAAIKGNAAAE